MKSGKLNVTEGFFKQMLIDTIKESGDQISEETRDALLDIIERFHILPESSSECHGITKDQAIALLKEGKSIAEIFDLIEYEKYQFYKAKEWDPGDTVLYIPDLWNHGVPAHVSLLLSDEDIETMMQLLFTGRDFIEICEGDKAIAKEVFENIDGAMPKEAYEDVEWW